MTKLTELTRNVTALAADDRLYVVDVSDTTDGAAGSSGYTTPASLATYAVAAVPNATASARGTVELATVAEADTGTDTVRAVTPAGLAKRVKSDPAGITGADALTNMVSLTQAEYNAIGSKSATTLYVIVG